MTSSLCFISALLAGRVNDGFEGSSEGRMQNTVTVGHQVALTEPFDWTRGAITARWRADRQQLGFKLFGIGQAILDRSLHRTPTAVRLAKGPVRAGKLVKNGLK